MSRIFTLQQAEECLKNERYEDALGIYFLCLIKIEKSRRNAYETLFRKSLDGWIYCDALNSLKLYEMLPQIEELFENPTKIVISILRGMYSLQNLTLLPNMLDLCKKSLRSCVDEESASCLRLMKTNLSSLAFSQWHMKMINDGNRNRAFEYAISQTPSRVTYDIGTGTGLLAVIAARTASQKVIAIEENSQLCKIAENVISKNTNSGKIKILNCNSTAFQPTDKADLIVSEILDCCIFGENIVSTFLDAHQKFAKPSTIFIPSRAKLYVRLFYSEKIHKLHVQNQYRSTYVRTSKEDKQEDPYWCCQKTDYPDFLDLSEPVELINVNFQSYENLSTLEKMFSTNQCFMINPSTSGVAHGVAVNFVADLLPNETCQIDSSHENSCWDLGIFPFSEPLNIAKDIPVRLNWTLLKNRLDIWVEPTASNYKVRGDTLRSYPDQVPAGDQVLDLSSGSFSENREYEENQLPYTSIFTRLYNSDGSFDTDAFLRLEGALQCLKNIEKIIPRRVKVVGKLFKCDRIHRESRSLPEMHCDVDLDLNDFNLKEFRDIDWAVQSCSEEFEVFEFDLDLAKISRKQYSNIVKKYQINCFDHIDAVDGVIYEFESDGICNQVKSAFLFETRRPNNSKFGLIFDFQEGQMLISENNIYRAQ